MSGLFLDLVTALREPYKFESAQKSVPDDKSARLESGGEVTPPGLWLTIVKSLRDNPPKSLSVEKTYKFIPLFNLLDSGIPNGDGRTFNQAYGVETSKNDNLDISRQLSNNFDDMKKGSAQKFFAAVLHCLWVYPDRFPKMSGTPVPLPFDPFQEDGDISRQERKEWIIAAISQLSDSFDTNRRRSAPPKLPVRSRSATRRRVEAPAIILSNHETALQRIAYVLKEKEKAISLRDLDISRIPEELFQLTWLESLLLTQTKLQELPDMSRLPHLKELNLSYSKIERVDGLKGCKSLEKLFLGATPLTSLNGLEECINLKHLYCGETGITSLQPLSQCVNLETLYIDNTNVLNLAGIEKCVQMRTLLCSGSAISSLRELENMDSLERLFLSRCHIRDDSIDIWLKPSLQEVVLDSGKLGNVPLGVLSKSQEENCLSNLREFFEIGGTEINVNSAKLFVLGNGGVGKTQLCRMVMGLPYDSNVKTTHGVDIYSLNEKVRESDVRVQLWDFGGQSLYHGVHTLFLRDHSLYIIAWSPEDEKGFCDSGDDLFFENHPLTYWIDFVSAMGGSDSPLILAETKIDASERVVAPPLDPEALSNFSWYKTLRTTAKSADAPARLTLLAAITAAASRVIQGSRQKVPLRWLQVVNAIVKLRHGAIRGANARAGITLPRKAKRVITRQEFAEICALNGITGRHDGLLHYLDATGEIIYRPGFAEDKIIIDQNWALEAVYALLDRSGCYKSLVDNNGRFTKSDLARWVWDDRGYSPAEQDLFISFMALWGLCFAIYAINDIVTYVSPAALPNFPEHDIWRSDWATISRTYSYAVLHDGFFNSLISRFGRVFRLNGDYWREGVQAYDEKRGLAYRMIRRQSGGWPGSVLVEVQYADKSMANIAERLLLEMGAHVEEQERENGVYQTGIKKDESLITEELELDSEDVVAMQTDNEIAIIASRILRDAVLLPLDLFSTLANELNVPLESRGRDNEPSEKRWFHLMVWCAYNGNIRRLRNKIIEHRAKS